MSDCIKSDFINDFCRAEDLNRLKKTNAKLDIISTIHKKFYIMSITQKNRQIMKNNSQKSTNIRKDASPS